MSAIDNVTSRNATRIFIVVNGLRIGRVQSFSEDQANNVQVITELGRNVAVEMKAGVRTYSFSIARFVTRTDAFDPLKKGAPFSLEIRDSNLADDGGNGAAQALEYFQTCMIQSVSTSFSNGQTTVGQNAQVVTIGDGQDAPR